MTCQIEVEIDFGDCPDFASEKMLTARKEHKCTECGRAILPGEKYEKLSGRWGYEFEVFKTCADCLSVKDNLFCNFMHGMMWECVQEEIKSTGGDGIAKNLAGLTPVARARVCEMLEAHWGEQKGSE